MATLQAHGSKVGQVDYLTYSLAVMSDGIVLRNQGFGWKRYATIKTGHTPEQSYEHISTIQAVALDTYPHLRNYRRALHELAGLSKRWKIHTAVELNPDDPDGVWSEVADGYGDNVHATVEEIVELCQLYKLYLAEKKAGRKVA